MADEKSTAPEAAAAPESTETKKVEGAGVDVVEVKPQGEDATEEYNREQNAALMHYKLTGERGVFIDPTRDQEPDIAPELGVSPHPELANPKAPGGPYTGVNLDASRNPVLRSVEDKTKRAEEVEKQREEAKNAAVESTSGTEQAADPDSPAKVDPGRGEGSPTVAEGNARATEANTAKESSPENTA